MFRRLSNINLFKINHARNIQTVSEDFISRPFIFKRFNEVKIGDIFQDVYDFKFYRIHKKVSSEEYFQHNCIEKVRNVEGSLIPDIDEYIESFKIKRRSPQIKKLKIRDHIRVFDFSIGTRISSFGSEYKIDMSRKNFYYHVPRTGETLRRGDVFRSVKNGQYYKVLDHVGCWAANYGDDTPLFDHSYLNCVIVDPMNNLNNKTDKVEKFEIGHYQTHIFRYIGILDINRYMD